MYFKQFSRKLSESLNGSGITEQIHCYGHLIEKTSDGSILIDGDKTDYQSINEARTGLCEQQYFTSIEQEIAEEFYHDIPDEKVAEIIKEYHDVRVTDTLIESYRELVSSKIFTVDPIAQKIRSLNSYDNLFEHKIDYILNDGSIIAISEETQTVINNLLQSNKEIVSYMRESKEQFMWVMTQVRN